MKKDVSVLNEDQIQVKQIKAKAIQVKQDVSALNEDQIQMKQGHITEQQFNEQQITEQQMN